MEKWGEQRTVKGRIGNSLRKMSAPTSQVARCYFCPLANDTGARYHLMQGGFRVGGVVKILKDDAARHETKLPGFVGSLAFSQ